MARMKAQNELAKCWEELCLQHIDGYDVEIVAYQWSFSSQLSILVTPKETYICNSGVDFEGDIGK